MTVNVVILGKGERCHRQSLSAYIDGCRCDGCTERATQRESRRRNRQRLARGATVPCLICGNKFMSVGSRDQHELRVHSKENRP